MDKAILTQAQAEAIDSIQAAYHWTAEAFVRSHAENSHQWVAPCDVLNGVPLDTIIRALYIGYEVRQTMEERMLAHFKEPKGYLAEYDTENVIYRKGMAKALEIAGIKVPGIND
ncbi:hypothetical protein MF628_004929 [Paenibacillus polymyxa]|uniref:hypothetical protein n=1 Tax=Paenibacillus polymyxa TaxID=1406 RepID=UPI0020243167|nr:hypothetical protein [Paenibacillus polymyxa]URJ45147.1 hypothetical protein MF628_004929 [Paenibacillus polymyxa]